MNHSLKDFVVYSGNRVAEISDKIYLSLFEARNSSEVDEVLANLSYVVIELESHQKALEERIQREEDLAVMAQAEQYQVSLNKLVGGYKTIEGLLKKRLR